MDSKNRIDYFSCRLPTADTVSGSNEINSSPPKASYSIKRALKTS